MGVAKTKTVNIAVWTTNEMVVDNITFEKKLRECLDILQRLSFKPIFQSTGIV